MFPSANKEIPYYFVQNVLLIEFTKKKEFIAMPLSDNMLSYLII